MRIADKVVVVAGATSGIGRALAIAFAAEGARTVICADRDEAGAKTTAKAIGGVPWRADVGDERQIHSMIDDVELRHGTIDLFCSNAGIYVGGNPSDQGAHLVQRHCTGAFSDLDAQHRGGVRR